MRELKLIFIAVIASLFIGIGLFQLSDIGDQALEREKGVAFEVIQSGADGPIEEGSLFASRKNFVLRTGSDYENFWDILGAGEKPSVIFTKDQVIAVFQGTQLSAGYKIEVTDIRDTPDKRVVFIKMTVPGPLCEVAEIITNPYQIIKVPKSDKTLTAIETFEKISCS